MSEGTPHNPTEHRRQLAKFVLEASNTSILNVSRFIEGLRGRGKSPASPAAPETRKRFATLLTKHATARAQLEAYVAEVEQETSMLSQPRKAAAKPPKPPAEALDDVPEALLRAAEATSPEIQAPLPDRDVRHASPVFASKALAEPQVIAADTTVPAGVVATRPTGIVRVSAATAHLLRGALATVGAGTSLATRRVVDLTRRGTNAVSLTARAIARAAEATALRAARALERVRARLVELQQNS